MVYVVIARVPESGLAEFADYERLVLPLLSDHSGRLERRLRSPDGCSEVHLIEFPSEQAFSAYRGDPRRLEHAPLLERSGASIELLALEDV